MGAASAVAAAATVANAVMPQKITMDASDATTIINNINTLYANAFDQFISILFGGLAFFGIILPIAFGYFQNRKAKADQKELKDKIDEEIQAAKTLLIKELKLEVQTEKAHILKEVAEMKKELKLETRKIQARGNAKTHHLQANSLCKNGDYAGAFNDCVTAVRDYATANEESNLTRVVDKLLNQLIFPKLKKTDFDETDSLKKGYEEIIEVLTGMNANGRYLDSILELKKQYKAALVREASTGQ